jgi:hypothetical protein
MAISYTGFVKSKHISVSISKPFVSLQKIKSSTYCLAALMNRNTIILFIYILLSTVKLFAQTEPYPGTWQMDYPAGEGRPPIHAELKIAPSEKNILYPAELLLQCDSFSATYQLLLVKKNTRELAISKNKYRVSEKPFSLVNIPSFLNGIFDHSKNQKAQSTLTISRLKSKPAATAMPDSLKFDKPYRNIGMQLVNFLKEAEIIFTKTSSIPWNDKSAERILSPSLSPVYFGLLDSIYLPTRDGIIHLSDNKKDDVVSVALNGSTVIDRLALNKKPHTDDILLDTGLNTLVLFAENFGNDLPNAGKARFEFGHKKFNLDFGRRIDSGASFIVAQFYFAPERDKEIYFQDYILLGDPPLKENEKLIGTILSTSRQLTLAIWDDAVEDGDTISISINDQWIAKDFPVKKATQFITVTLKPGPNTINFIANNLGSIPPNTSVLEIIDGKKRKSYMLETVMGENNLIKIFYQLAPY